MDHAGSSRKGTVLRLVGAGYILAGVLINTWSLAALFSPDGVIESRLYVIAILTFEIILLTWGAVTIVFREREFVGNINLLVISAFVISPLVGELVLRVAISLNVSWVRRPELYADQFADDDYWKLHYEWTKTDWLPLGGYVDKGGYADSLLGWATPRTHDNPLGIVIDRPFSPDPLGRTVLFYGDSFVEGLTAYEAKIPQRLDHLLSNCTVYNLAVGGYGVDQVFLRFKATHFFFREPTILFGILTEDLYRTVLTARPAPKPYFVLHNDTLVLKGVPVPPDPVKWLAQNPPSIRSYVLALIARKLRSHQGGDDTYRRSEIKALNAAIIREAIGEARHFQLPMIFVIFYAQSEVQTTDWKESFLKDQFARLSVPYIDTKEILLNSARAESTDVGAYYYQDNGHPNERGNMKIAEGIAGYFRAHSMCAGVN